MDDTFDLSNFLGKNCAGMENLLHTKLPAEIAVDESLLDTTLPEGIVANDSLVLTRKWLAANALRNEDEEDDEEILCSMDSVIATAEIVADESFLDTAPPAGIVANDSLVLTRKWLAANALRKEDEEEDLSAMDPVIIIPDYDNFAGDDEEFLRSVDSVIVEGNDTFELSQELTTPAERLMDVSLSSLMNVEIDYSLEFPTGALGRVPHIFVAKYKRDIKRKAAAEEALRKEAEKKKNAVPSLMVTSPSDGDLCFDNRTELEFEIQDIVSQSFKDHLLDGSWHNWNMRFNFENVLLELAESEAFSYDANEVY